MFALNNSLQNNGEKSAVNIHKRPTNEPTSSQWQTSFAPGTHALDDESIMSHKYTQEIDNAIQTTFN